jgi:hypothetical protein
LAGGAGADTLTIVDTGSADLTLAAAKVGGIEVINITNQTGNTVSAGSKEVATVTVGALQNGQYITVAGQTLSATADLSAADVASALAGGTVSGATLSGTLTSGYVKAAGTNSDTVTYTGSAVGNKADLEVGGNSGENSKQVSIITAGGTVVSTDVTTFTYNGVTLTTAAHGATTAASVATAVKDAINGYAGSNIATASGATVQVVSSTPVSLAGFDATGATATTYAVKNAAATQTIAVTASSASATATMDILVNGETITTGVVGADATTAAAAIVAAINTWAGQTIASNSTNTVTVDGGDYPIAIGEPVESAGTYTFVLTDTAAAAGVTNADATTISVSNGTAAVTAATFDTTADASKFTDATEMASVNSTGDVVFSNMVSTQSGTVAGNTAITNGNTTFGHKATATSAAVSIEGGTTAGDISLTGAGLTTVAITSTGEKNTVGTIDVACAKTVTIDAATNLTATQLDTTGTAGTLTVSGAGAVKLGSLDAGFETVNFAGNSGGVTATMSTGIKTLTGGSGDDTITTAAIAATSTVTGGSGDDLLILAASTDLDTAAEAAKYSGFETLRAASGSFDASLVSTINNIQMTGAGTLSGMTAAQAANVQIRADGAYGVALNVDTGTADSVSIDLGTGTTTAAAVNISTALTANGFETINLTTNQGPDATSGANQISTIASFTADKVTAINLNGSSFNITNIATTKAVTIDGSNLTGDGSATPVGLVTAGDGASGSTIIGSDHADTFTITAEGQTYKGGAGNDTFVISSADPEALTEADGSTDLVLDGGASTTGDALKYLSTTATDVTTLTDVAFNNVSNMEKLILSNTGNLSLTTGGNFNSAFASGVTITTGALLEASDVTIAAGLSTVDMTITIDAALIDGNGAAEDSTITTGSGADKVTFAGDATYTGGITSGTITIDTNAGDDTISVTVGTITTDSDNLAISVDGGAGQDTITLEKVNGGNTGAAGSQTHLGHAKIIVTSGESTTSAYDTVVGFDLGGTTTVSDNLDFTGTEVVSDFSNSTNFGTIATHSISNGVASFDDAENYATALVISSDDLADVLGYLAANTDNNDTVAFTYDNNNDGVAESSMVYHNGAAGEVDSLVLLSDVTVLGLSTDINETAGYVQIA